MANHDRGPEMTLLLYYLGCARDGFLCLLVTNKALYPRSETEPRLNLRPLNINGGPAIF